MNELPFSKILIVWRDKVSYFILSVKMYISCSPLTVHTEFWWGNLRVRDHWKDPGLDGRIILKLTQEVGGGMNWIDLARNRGQG